MFEYALKAHMPIIGVRFDDPLNTVPVLEHWAAPRKVRPYPTSKAVVINPDYLYYTGEAENITVDVYGKMMHLGVQLVYINPSSPNALVFDAGDLPTPEKFVVDYLKELVPEDTVPVLVPALKGLSLRRAAEVVQLSAAMFGEITLKSINATRIRLEGQKPGLSLMDTDIDLWVPDPYIDGWIKLNKKFMATGTMKALLPRGLILDGPPGVGKSYGARVIAKEFGVPLFRLEIGTTLNKYIGESEGRLANALDTLAKAAPCVGLIDEVEKTFNVGGDDQGTVQRMLGQLLWWLQERNVPAPLIMTTNALEKVPPELYRGGRLDMVIQLRKMNLEVAREFALDVLNTLVGKSTVKQRNIVRDSVHGTQGLEQFSHAQVRAEVIQIVKEHGWV